MVEASVQAFIAESREMTKVSFTNIKTAKTLLETLATLTILTSYLNFARKMIYLKLFKNLIMKQLNL